MVLANKYLFDQGADGDLVYLDPDVSGGPQLIYKGKSYTGNEINVEKSDIGKLVTVTLKTVPDTYTKFLTLLVPPVNFASPNGAAYVVSYAIISKSLTTIAGPDGVSGQVISYEALFVAGSASQQTA